MNWNNCINEENLENSVSNYKTLVNNIVKSLNKDPRFNVDFNGVVQVIAKHEAAKIAKSFNITEEDVEMILFYFN